MTTLVPIRNIAFGIAGVVLAASAAYAAEEEITAVRFWSLGDVTRIAIEGSGPFHFKYDRLENPDRLFFDLIETRPRLGHKGISTIHVGDKFLKQIRVAETQRGVTRVVLDLESELQFTTSQLENPDRLIIELHGPGAPPVAKPLIETTVNSAKPPPAVFRPPAAREQPRSEPAPEQAALLEPSAVLTASVEPLKTDGLRKLASAEAAGARIARPAPQSPAAANVTPAPAAPAARDEVGLPAKRTSPRDESMIRALGLKVRRIVIDAGHGGHDTGSIGPGGLLEKDLVLDVARRLGELVSDRLGSEVIYTRTDDTFIPLEQRTEIANNNKADLFLSIHANSSSFRAATGIETYYLNFTTSKTALEVAARENATSQKSIYDLQDLVQKIALKDKIDESREFAVRIQNSLYSATVHNAGRSRDRGVRKAPFIVLIGASMPSVLAEIGFISNPRDESLMRRPEYRQKVAEALYKGLASYAGTLSHFQMAQRD